MRRSITIYFAPHEAVIVKRILKRVDKTGDLSRKAHKAISPIIDQLEKATLEDAS